MTNDPLFEYLLQHGRKMTDEEAEEHRKAINKLFKSNGKKLFEEEDKNDREDIQND